MAALNAVADLTVEGDIAIITLNSPPVNALSSPVREGIHSGISKAVADPADLEAVFQIEAMTNDRLREEAGDLALVRYHRGLACFGSSH